MNIAAGRFEPDQAFLRRRLDRTRLEGFHRITAALL